MAGEVAKDRTIGTNTKVSIALVVILVTGVVSQIAMMNSTDARAGRIEGQAQVMAKVLESTQDDVGEIKVLLQRMSDGMQKEITDLRATQMTLRERITKLEALFVKEPK